jgi:DNA-binding NarL/FixJ family response regulator
VSSPRRIRVIVGEDQPFVREGIVHVLQDGGFDVVGTTANARDLLQMADAYGPDVVVTDIQMPPDDADDGLRAALAIRAANPELRDLPMVERICPGRSAVDRRSFWLQA